MSLRTKWILAGVFLALSASFGVFLLPFLFPPAPIQAVSAANTGGFNNRIAVLVAGTLAVLALIIFERLRPRVRLPTDEAGRPMTRRFILGWAVAVGTLSAVLVGMVYRANIRYSGDFDYFIAPMTKLALDHRKLYTEVDFPYGPLLIYPPVWLRSLFAWFERPIAAAYGAVYVTEQVGGLLLLAYVLQVLPIRTSLRRSMFVVMAVFALSPGVGANYTFFRFAAPLAIFIFSVRRRRLRVAVPLLLVGQMVSLGISPEMGFSFGCGTIIYGVFRTIRDRRAWAAVLFLPMIGAALFLLVVGGGYLHMVALFSGGVYNLIVEPEPHVLSYLVALLWLVPLALATAWRERQTDAALLYGIYGMGLGLLPVAFGRADPGHILFNGLPILLLSLITVSTWRQVGRWIWICVLASVVLFYQWTQCVLYRVQLADLPSLQSARLVVFKLRDAVRHQHSGLPFWAGHPKIEDGPSETDLDRLQALVKSSRVCGPYGLSLAWENSLRKRNLFQPGAYFEMRDVLDRRSEQQQIAEMDLEHWALLPKNGPVLMSESPEMTQFLLGIPLPYRSKRAPYVSGSMLEAELRKNWHFVATINGSLLYRRNW